MWNKRLNEKYTNRLIGYLQDKRVIVVGNSLSMFSKPYGEFIDSFDVVIRLGKGYPWPEFRENLGSKTHVWMLSIIRANHYKEFRGVPYQVLNISQISVYDMEKPTTSISKHFYESDFEIYNHYFLMGNLQQTRAIIKEAYGKVDMKERASQGVMTLAYLTRVIKSYKELHVIGFDFFEGRVQYELEGHINEVSSYHMPVPTLKGKNSSPHTGSSADNHPDKDYVMKLKNENKIILHEMEPIVRTPELDQKMQLIMQKYRKTGKLLSVGNETEQQNNEESNEQNNEGSSV